MTEADNSWASRKLGAETSATRTALIIAAQRLLLKEGYGAVTSRRVASEAGLKPQLVHYYFRSMDDLLLEVFRQSAEQGRQELAAVLEAEDPLRALWEFMSDPRPTTFTTEFTAIASRSPVIREEVAKVAEEFRGMQTEAIVRHLKKRGITPRIPPVVASVRLVSLSAVLVREKALGMTMGHKETEAFVEECFRGFQDTGEPPKAFSS